MPVTWLKCGLVFSSYIFWLISLPMSGHLLPDIGSRGLLFFLLPHAGSLFAIGRFLPARYFDRTSLIAVGLTVLLTLFFSLAGAYSSLFLALLGVSGAFLAIRVVTILKASSDYILSAAFGLALGNLLVFLVMLLPLAEYWKMTLIALPLVSAASLSVTVVDKGEIGELKKSLPLIFVFYLIGGLFYGFMIPSYRSVSIYPGVELIIYMLTVLAGVFILKRNQNREITLALGIIAGAVSFSLISVANPLFINLAMFASQASFALVDMYLLVLIISLGATLRIAGFGLGVMVSSIMSGEVISSVAPAVTKILIATGNIILIMAVLLLYFVGRKTQKDTALLKSIAGVTAEDPSPAALVERLNQASEYYQKKISPQEKEVLKLVLRGKTYREVATELAISESSVKTYMSRIYEKTGCVNKEELFSKLEQLP